MLLRHQPKSLFLQILLLSGAPLLLYTLITVSEHTLFSRDHGVQNELSFFQILLKTKSAILQAYSNFISFCLLMTALNLVSRIFRSQNSTESEDKNSLPSVFQKESHPKGKTPRYQRIFFTVLSYGMIYIFLRYMGSIFGLSFENNNHPSGSLSEILPKTVDPFTLRSTTATARALEQQQEEEGFVLTESNQLPSNSDIKTLSIGKSLSFLNINPAAIILSKSQKLAFVITIYYGGLKIIDISDPQYPTIIGNLDLSKIDRQFKTLKLSVDEKTLFASTTERLEIINVANPKSPSLISFFEDSATPDINTPSGFLPTLALSKDQNVLYVAGLGLQIFNITNVSNPKLVSSVKSPQIGDKFTVTSLALLPDINILAYANNTLLEFYDVSDPIRPVLRNSYSGKISISSIAFSRKYPQFIYALGFLREIQSHQQVALEKINLQEDSLSPQSVELYDLNSTSISAPCIMGISSNETNVFALLTIMKKEASGSVSYMDMIGFDLLKKKIMTQSTSLLQLTKAIAIIPQNNHVLVGSHQRFEILEFSTNYPNTKAFCRFDNTNNVLQFPPVNILEPASSNIWLAFSPNNIFSSYNMTNQTSPQILGTYQFPSTTFIQRISHTQNRAFLQIDSSKIIAFDTSSEITYLGSLLSTAFIIKDFEISTSENIAYVIQKSAQNLLKISAINFTDFSSVIEVPFAEIPSEFSHPKIVLSKNRPDLLFVMMGHLHIYNISNPMFPALIAPPQQIIPSSETNGPHVFSLTFSPDTKTLFVLMFDMALTYTLRILDTSNLTHIKLIQAFALPRIASEPGRNPFVLSSDMKKGFVITDSNLLVLDLRNLTFPDVLGVIPFRLVGGKAVQNFFLSLDEKTGYIHSQSQVLKINLELSYTLFLPQENFLIGKKYSDSVMLLNAHKEADFILTSPADYKIIKLSLYNIQIFPSQGFPTTTYTSLPSWISFDSENQILTIEPKRQRDLGSYTLYSISSKEIPLNAFQSVLNSTFPSEDMLTLLISLGYVDNQRFLTANFGLEKNFLLPSTYADFKDKIFQTLQSYRIETFTDFNILPSLKISPSSAAGKFSISSTNNSSVEAEITLLDIRAQFLQKMYGTLVPVITNHKNRLKIEGSLDHINEALREMVININSSTGTTACQGEITINDNLNPPISQFYENICAYFFHNEAPLLNAASHNSTVQQQIDFVKLYTGQYFSISLDPYSFEDKYTESLTYQLITKEDNQQDDSLPSWLSFQGLTIKGTPPEDVSHRQFKFELIIKNEFKQIEVPLVLNVRVSWQFVGKLLIKYGPYILTAVGLYISANKLYNILLKKRYRHAKEFYLKVGEQINSSIIFPIRFIAEEKLEGDMILKYLKNQTFLESETEAIQEAINKRPANDKQKLKLYSRESGQKRVYQYILNELIMRQLNSHQESATKNVFNRIKDKWVDFIEYDDNSGFKVNEKSLNILLEKDSLSEASNESPLLDNDALNIDLLKKALVVHAVKNHELNDSHANVDVLVHLKKSKNGIFRFFKKDFQRILYSDKGKFVFGLTYQIQNATLEISGTPEDSFEGNVLVVQIVNKHQRILKEIWIHGALNRGMSELEAKGKEYEIF